MTQTLSFCPTFGNINLNSTICHCYLRKEKRKKEKDSGKVIQEANYTVMFVLVYHVTGSDDDGRAMTSFPVG